MKSVAILAFSVALASAFPGALHAQAKPKDIPASARPPAGMCRIWLDDVPAAQQPAPTDCASAVRNRPAKGRVIFGDDYVAPAKRADSTKKAAPAIKGFAPSSRGKKPRSPFIRRP